MVYPESAVCSRFREQIGIPSHLFNIIIKICFCIASLWILWFRVPKYTPFIQKLAYAQDVTNPAAKERTSRINEDAVTEWLHFDGNVIIIHHYTDSVIVHMVVSPEKNGSEIENSDGKEEDGRERIYIDNIIKNCSNFLLQYIQP